MPGERVVGVRLWGRGQSRACLQGLMAAEMQEKGGWDGGSPRCAFARLFTPASFADHPPHPPPLPLHQIMEEIIAKSKMYRALKARQKEEDEAELEKVRCGLEGGDFRGGEGWRGVTELWPCTAAAVVDKGRARVTELSGH